MSPVDTHHTTPDHVCDPDRSGIRSQFGHPTGLLGWLVGHLMAVKNAERSRWVLAQLDLQLGDRVLEIGFGSGVDMRRASERTRDGRVAGVDHSALMLRQARRRNAAAIRAGQVDLRLGTSAALPFPDAAFDKAFSINAVQFWEDPARSLAELSRVLRSGGLVAVAIQPRSKGATEATSREWGRRLTAGLADAGFTDVRLTTKPMRPVPVVCALGTR